MTRTEAMTIITAKLASLDDERVQAVAEIVEDIAAGDGMVRQLTAAELALVEQSKADFKAGRTLSIDEARARTDAFLAQRRALRTQK
jgi:hypothetical protein